MRHIDNCTMVIIDTLNYSKAIISLKNSLSECSFDRVLFLTDVQLDVPEAEVIIIPTIHSKDEYSQFVMKHLWEYITTDYVLITQQDSWILNGHLFPEELYEIDYAGALWLETDGLANGNGGFSWRSKRLCETVGKDDFINSATPEDVSHCRVYRSYLETKYGLKWASDELCERFSYELRAPIQRTFGFHSFFHPEYKEHIVLKRTASLGDLIMLELVIDYYAEKGLQVVIDTIPEFMQAFSRYRHKLIHISQMDVRIKPVRTISFDMAYEINPKQLVAKSYTDLTGENIPLRNSILNFPLDNNGSLFSKYILIHVDETGLNHRNCQGVNWDLVVSYYQRLGYQVFQTGKRMKEQVAPFINLSNIDMLMFMIAGADLFIGIDSSPLQMAVGLGTLAIGMFGSVNWRYRYLPTEKMIPLHTPCVKEDDDFCYHSETGTTGVTCKYNSDNPPCVQFNEWEIIRAANKLLKLN